MFVLDREDFCEDGNNEYEDSGGMMLNPKYDEDPDSEWKYINEADERGQDEDPEQDQLGPATYIVRTAESIKTPTTGTFQVCRSQHTS